MMLDIMDMVEVVDMVYMMMDMMTGRRMDMMMGLVMHR